MGRRSLCISGSGCFGMGVTIRGTTGHGQNTRGCPLLGMATWLHLVPGPNLRFRYLDESRALLSILAGSKFALLLNRHRSFVCVLGDSESEAKMWALWTTRTVWPRYQEWWVQFSTCSAAMPAKRNRQSVIVFWDQKLKSDHHVYLCLPKPLTCPCTASWDCADVNVGRMAAPARGQCRWETSVQRLRQGT